MQALDSLCNFADGALIPTSFPFNVKECINSSSYKYEVPYITVWRLQTDFFGLPLSFLLLKVDNMCA